MRILPVAAVLSFLLLAGCTMPNQDDDEEEPDPLFGLCPQWVAGTGEQSGGFTLGSNNETERTIELGPAPAEHERFPLDVYRITLTNLTVDGRLELRAYDSEGRQAGIRDFRIAGPQITPVVAFTDGKAKGDEFEVYLDPITGEGSAYKAPVSLRWTLEGADAFVTFDVTYHYKVCGAGDL